MCMAWSIRIPSLVLRKVKHGGDSCVLESGCFLLGKYSIMKTAFCDVIFIQKMSPTHARVLIYRGIFQFHFLDPLLQNWLVIQWQTVIVHSAIFVIKFGAPRCHAVNSSRFLSTSCSARRGLKLRSHLTVWHLPVEHACMHAAAAAALAAGAAAAAGSNH